MGKTKFRRQRSLHSICHEDAFVKLLKDAPTCRKIVSWMINVKFLLVLECENSAIYGGCGCHMLYCLKMI